MSEPLYHKEKIFSAQRSRKFAILSVLALMAILIFHIAFRPFYPAIPKALLIIVLVLPLALPLRGMLKSRHKSYVWASYLCVFYFLLAVDTFVSYDRSFALAVFFLVSLWFSSCFLFVRSRAKVAKSTKDNAQTNKQT